MGYLNFAVDVSSLPNGRYRIRVSAPVGEASADLDSPFTPPEIANYLAILGRTQRVSRTEELATARELGQRLFDFVIRGSSDINAAYIASLERAGANGLRFRLTVDNAGDLRQLPWEYLRDPNRDFLALSRLTPIVRYTPQLDVRPPVAIRYPVRVLVMISAPADYPSLDVEGEWRRLNEATAELQTRGLMILERLDSATLIALQRRLRRSEYHVFHYIGHSDYHPETGQGLLAFESEADETKTQVITGEALGRELGEETTLRLIVLNSCHSARRPDTDALQGISSSLVARGLPAVVAMQFAITDSAAKVFAEEFYRVLAEMSPIDTAVSEARRAIANRLQNSEWAIPVLFMRSDTGILFSAPSADETRPVLKPVDEETRPHPRAAALPRPTVLLGIVALIVIVILVGLLRGVVPAPSTPTPAPPTLDPANLPDLQVGSVRISPRRPAPGEIFNISITFTNAGNADTGPFTWSWDASAILLDAAEGRVENILPGASKSISFSYNYGWWGEFDSIINVDVESEVTESEERNNRRPFPITLADDLPFVVDFSLLPNNTVVETPFRLGSDDFFPWNLDFTVGSLADAACIDTPLDLLDHNVDDVILTIGAEADPACALQALNITIIRNPVADAQIEIIPALAGVVTLRLYSNPSGGEPIFVSEPQAVNPGEQVTLGAFDGQPRLIRRIEISLDNQPVRLTQLTLLPVLQSP